MHTQQVSLPNYVHTARQFAKCTHSASICQIMHTQCVSAKLCTHSGSICQIMHTQHVSLPLKCTHSTHIQTWEEPKQTSLKFKMLHSPALKWGKHLTTLSNAGTTVLTWGREGGGGRRKKGSRQNILKKSKSNTQKWISTISYRVWVCSYWV